MVSKLPFEATAADLSSGRLSHVLQGQKEALVVVH